MATIDVTDTNQVSFASDTVTINPTADLASLTEYYVQIDGGAITDLGANPYAGIVDPDTTSWSFTTADATLPTLLSTSPADNATGVALGADLVATFSEPVQAGTGNITIKRTSDDVAVATIDVTDTNQVSFASDTVTINPTADSASLTEYYVQIDATAITDLAANPYAGIVDPDTTSWSFTTADATLPTLLSTSPADNATGVALGADLVATFSEPVQAGTGNITIKRTSDDVAVATIDVTDTNQVSFASDTVTINPTADLASLTEYYVQIDATAITDLGGQPLCGDRRPGHHELELHHGRRDAADAPVDQSGRQCDGRGGGRGSGGDLQRARAGGDGEHHDQADQRRRRGGHDRRHRHEPGELRERHGNDQSNGRSGQPDRVLRADRCRGHYGPRGQPLCGDRRPGHHELELHYGRRDAADAPIDQPGRQCDGRGAGRDLVAIFSEPVQAGTGNITIKRTSDDVAVATIDVTDTNQVSFASDTVTINPTADLASLTEYYVQIDGGAITDLGANPYAGIVDPDTTSWSFTTADATLPTLLSTSPADNATGVVLGADLVATFSEPVQAGTGNITIKRTSDDVAVATIDVTDTNQVSFASDTVTINPTADLASLTEYYVQIDGGAITDLGANPYAGIVDPDTTSWSFTTADATLPTLLSTSPADNATGVALGADLVATFSEPVQAGTGNITIKRTSDDVAVATIDVTDTNQVSFASDTVTINPTADLASLTEYYVQIDATAITDLAANPYAGIVDPDTTSWSFTTADATLPTLLSTSPADNATGVALGADLVATFSEPVQAGTGNITIKRTSDDVAVATIDVTDTNQVSFASDTVTINPTADLASLTEYYVQIDATAITDLGANPYAGIVDPDTTSWSFTTADATLPTLLSTSPADNATGVALGRIWWRPSASPCRRGRGTSRSSGPATTSRWPRSTSPTRTR